MSVKLVMGAQRDSLEKLEKFGGEDGGVIFPHFRQVLENALRFELGEVGVMILRNQFPMDTIKRGERVDKVPGLITMLLAKNRSDIQFKSSWIETTKEVDIADPEKEYDVITAEGEMNLRAAIVKIKSSIFNSISEHGLQEGSSVKKDFDKLKTTYTENTLHDWIDDMETTFGIGNADLLDAYVNQLTQLRVMKVNENSDIVRNLLALTEQGGGDGSDVDYLHDFEMFDEERHKVSEFHQAIKDVIGEIKILVSSEKCEMPECTDERKIGEKIMKGLVFSDYY